MMKVIYLLAGGALGSFSRYYISGITHKVASGIFPWGTLLVNVTGAFVIGLLWGIFELKDLSPNIRIFVFVGFLGGYTTFSTFALETLNLLRDGNFKFAILNVVMNNLLALTFVFGGYFIAKGILTLIK
ncbi:MAG: fluoride efflux transporter CrcB [Bacteroidales bacterium]|nr:fluoride efflux transporter CrcB [Bacteroidales bacterium]MCF8404561.1 fluoride efflux transporter CrcB [Bacteroidales bacterium]